MNYALIGCGRIAVNHIKAAVNNKLDIVAVCDIEFSHIDVLFDKTKFSEIYEVKNVKKYSDYKKMIDEIPDVNLIAIATDSGVHAEIAKYCIEKNINVIIEKPMAMSMKAQLMYVGIVARTTMIKLLGEVSGLLMVDVYLINVYMGLTYLDG